MITLTGQAKSTNHIYKYACRGNNPCMYLSDLGSTLKEQYALEARSQWRSQPLKGDVEVNISFFHGDKRKRDVDNYNKLILDALSGIIYDDDKQIQRLLIEKYYDKDHPRIEINIKQL